MGTMMNTMRRRPSRKPLPAKYNTPNYSLSHQLLRNDKYVPLELKERRKSQIRKQQTEEAFCRLRILFPSAQEKVLRQMVKVRLL